MNVVHYVTPSLLDFPYCTVYCTFYVSTLKALYRTTRHVGFPDRGRLKASGSTVQGTSGEALAVRARASALDT